MKINQSVFGSHSESKVIKDLQRKWGETFSIHHNVPLLNIIGIDPNQDVAGEYSSGPDRFSAREYAYLKMTSVDIVLSDKNTEAPLIGIEFDGMRLGFSKATKYVPGEPDESRIWKMNIKCKCFMLANMPFFIISTRETGAVDSSTAVTLLDSIIGQMVSGSETWKDFCKELRTGNKYSQEDARKWFKAQHKRNRIKFDLLAKESSARLSQLIAAGRFVAHLPRTPNEEKLLTALIEAIKSGHETPYRAEYGRTLRIDESMWKRGVVLWAEDSPIKRLPSGVAAGTGNEDYETLIRDNLEIGCRFSLITTRGMVPQECFVRTVESIKQSNINDASKRSQIAPNIIVDAPPLNDHIDLSETAFFMAQTLAYGKFSRMFR